MNTKELVDHFITHSPKFNDDLGLDDIDDKHENIVKEAYLQINNGKAFTKNNFRNWKEQSDLGVPSQLSFSAANENGYLNMILKFAYRKLFRRDVDRFLLSAILDDIDVINTELALADLESVEKALLRVAKAAKGKDKDSVALQKVLEKKTRVFCQ